MGRAAFAFLLIIVSSALVLPRLLYDGRLMIVTTGSMAPAIGPYDLIVAQKVDAREIKSGDIIAFDTHLEDDGIITHRVVGVSKSREGAIEITTKGDALGQPDQWVIEGKDVIGKVTNVIPRLGFFYVSPGKYVMAAFILFNMAMLLMASREDETR